MAFNLTPKEFVESTLGKSYNTDGWYGAQCWDIFDYFCQKAGITASRYCKLTGYVSDIWTMRNYKGYEYSRWFTFITDPKKLQDGDWVFTTGHVTMYYQGKGVGQNQTYDNKKWLPYVAAMPFSANGFLGAFRYKFWRVDKPVEKPKGTTTTPAKKGTIETAGVATKRDFKNLSGTYKVTPTIGLCLRIGPSEEYRALTVLRKGIEAHCYAGYYDVDKKGRKWLYVQAKQDSRSYVGFVCMDYLKKV